MKIHFVTHSSLLSWILWNFPLIGTVTELESFLDGVSGKWQISKTIYQRSLTLSSVLSCKFIVPAHNPDPHTLNTVTNASSNLAMRPCTGGVTQPGTHRPRCASLGGEHAVLPSSHRIHATTPLCPKPQSWQGWTVYIWKARMQNGAVAVMCHVSHLWELPPWTTHRTWHTAPHSAGIFGYHCASLVTQEGFPYRMMNQRKQDFQVPPTWTASRHTRYSWIPSEGASLASHAGSKREGGSN